MPRKFNYLNKLYIYIQIDNIEPVELMDINKYIVRILI